MDNTLWIYGVIEPGGDVSATDVRDQLEDLDPSQPILARINSPGGSVFEAVAIYTQLSQWPLGVDVQIDGLAASAASYLATVGQFVAIARDGMVMLHDAWALTVGNSDDHRAAGEILDDISNVLTQAYVARTGRTAKEVRDVMKKETWFTAAGAIEFGLADAIVGDDGRAAVAASARTVAALQRRLDMLAT